MHDLIQGGARQENGTDQKVIASPEDEFENRRLKAYCPETILRFVGGAGASFAGMATVVLAALVLAMGESLRFAKTSVGIVFGEMLTFGCPDCFPLSSGGPPFEFSFLS
jgi:hypothetical protein